MRYNISCPDCSGKNQFTANVSPTNNGIYKIDCPNGHHFELDILSHHFQVLFENAINALSDDYYIEAFTCFASSYERFMEYFMRIIHLSNGIKKKNFEKTWKLISSRSERQQGAFIISYLQEFKENPSLISNKMTELRNNVIHKGHFPTEKECISFGNAILGFIRPIILLLKSNEKYEWHLIGSVNDYGLRYLENNIRGFLPHQIFAINRKVCETDEKSIYDFLIDQKKLKTVAKNS